LIEAVQVYVLLGITLKMKGYSMLFHDRTEAGQVLADKLNHFANEPDLLVLALPRGGVPVAAEVARALHAPLDLFVVRKLGVPGHEELAMGAIASGEVRILNREVVDYLHIPENVIHDEAHKELEELKRQESLYRHDRPFPVIEGKTVILIDDGLATGTTMRAAIHALKKLHPRRIIVAVPVGAEQTCEQLSDEVDELICAEMPEDFYGVGRWYDDFRPTSDETVQALLEEAAHEQALITG
jgi:putative phosphoribosyl transferase